MIISRPSGFVPWNRTARTRISTGQRVHRHSLQRLKSGIAIQDVGNVTGKAHRLDLRALWRGQWVWKRHYVFSRIPSLRNSSEHCYSACGVFLRQSGVRKYNTVLQTTGQKRHRSQQLNPCMNVWVHACQYSISCSHITRTNLTRIFQTTALRPAGRVPLPGWPPPLPCCCAAELLLANGPPRRLMFPILDTMLLPTASTAPRGEVRVGPSGAVSWTRNSLMAVPFQTPTVPFATCISLVKTNDHKSDSYHPRDSGDHSNEWMRMGEGSTPLT